MAKPHHPMRDWRHGQTPRVTLTDLAERVSVTPSHLSQIENWIKEPSLDLASRLQRETGIPMDQFAKEPARC